MNKNKAGFIPSPALGVSGVDDVCTQGVDQHLSHSLVIVHAERHNTPHQKPLEHIFPEVNIHVNSVLHGTVERAERVAFYLPEHLLI